MKTSNSLFKLFLFSTLLVIFILAGKQSHSQGRVLINEYLAWTGNSCSITSEYVELYNFGPGPANIGCFVLTDGDFSITIPPNTILLAGQYYVISGQDVLPKSCGNINDSTVVDLNWNACNCTSGDIPSTGDGFLTDGGMASEQLVLFNSQMEIIDAIVRSSPEPSSTVVTSNLGGGCGSKSFNLSDMMIDYEIVGESQGRNNSFARKVDGGCGWLKDTQQSAGGQNNTSGTTSQFDASLSVINPVSCGAPSAVVVNITNADYTQVFPMRYSLGMDIDSNAVYDFDDYYISGVDNTPNTIPISNLMPGIYRLVVETDQGCDLKSFNLNILDCNGQVLRKIFEDFVITEQNATSILRWKLGDHLPAGQFEIQKSENGIDFASLLTQQHNGTKTSYVATITTEESGTAYYRIKYLAQNQLAFYSDIKTVAKRASPSELKVYPTIISDRINVEIESNAAENAALTIVDLSGRTVYSKIIRSLPGMLTIDIPADRLSKGMYFIRYKRLTGKLQTSKIIKN
jgi:hypothetical protein